MQCSTFPLPHVRACLFGHSGVIASTQQGDAALAYQLIMVAPNMETSVSNTLAALNFEHWIFRIKRKIVTRGRIIERVAPIFPGYIFVFAQYAWAIIKNIIGVRGFVRFGGALQDVPDRVVQDLRAQADEHGVLAWTEPTYSIPGFKTGDAVKVFFPQFTLFGTFQNLLAPDRAVILVDWLGRLVPVSVSVGDLQGKPRLRRRPRYRRQRISNG